MITLLCTLFLLWLLPGIALTLWWRFAVLKHPFAWQAHWYLIRWGTICILQHLLAKAARRL